MIAVQAKYREASPISPSRYIFQVNSGLHRDRFARSLVDRAVELARQKGIPYLNLAETIAAAGGEKAYWDDLHLNEKGNRAVGSALFECLKAC